MFIIKCPQVVKFLASNMSGFFLLPPVTLYDFRILQDYGILLVTGRWRSRVDFFFQFRSISNHQVQVPKKCSTHFWMLTPLSNNQHTFQQKMCIKNPTQSANLHHLRHGFGHSHDGSLCPRICRIKGAILKAVRRFRTWKTHKSCSGFYSCWNFGCFVTHFWDLDGNYGLTSWQKLNIWPQETRQGMDFHLLS